MFRNKIFILVLFCAALAGVIKGQNFRAPGGQNENFNENFSENLTQTISYRSDNEGANNAVANVSAPDAQSFSNPLIINQTYGCAAENLNSAKFGGELDVRSRVAFCEAVQDVSVKLKRNWSPALRDEIRQIWQIFESQKIVVRPMKKEVSSNVLAAAEAFTDNLPNAGFNASFYLRSQRAGDKSFLFVFMHEMRHVYDFYAVWKNHSNITEAELEKRGFRIMGEIYQETPEKPRFFRLPTFWEDSWKNLSQAEIARKRDEKIEKFMRGNAFYKNLLKNAGAQTVGYQTVPLALEENLSAEEKENNHEKLPERLTLAQTQKEIPQKVKEISFAPEKAENGGDPESVLKAALANEKNLYYKMNNFVYDQNLELQCWKKQKVTENYVLSSEITRTGEGEKLLKTENAATQTKTPGCVLNFDLIKSDAADTFWAAPYLDQMPIKFDSFGEISGIKVARYNVLQPTAELFKKLAADYPHIKNFRAFVGTIYVAVEDAQIIKFWGTSFSQTAATGYEAPKTFGSYSATAIRQKLDSGIWVTSTLNTVAVTSEKDKMKPFSYVVKYENYRQAVSDVKILDDETAVR